jgi:hypothetical protein
MLKLRVGFDRRSINMRNHINAANRFCKRARRLRCAHDHAFIGAFEQIADGRIVAERLDTNAEPGPRFCDRRSARQISLAMLLNGEAKPMIHAVDQCISSQSLSRRCRSGPPLLPGLMEASVCR